MIGRLAARSANHSTESRGLKFQLLFLLLLFPRWAAEWRVKCLTSLTAFSISLEYTASISDVKLNFAPVHSVVRFFTCLIGFGWRVVRALSLSYTLTIPLFDLCIVKKEFLCDVLNLWRIMRHYWQKSTNLTFLNELCSTFDYIWIDIWVLDV